jgi:hypothetical protein
MAIFNSYVSLPEGSYIITLDSHSYPWKHKIWLVKTNGPWLGFHDKNKKNGFW